MEMKRVLFVTGTDTGVGKTVLTALLAAYLRGLNSRVAAFKPVCSGGREDARLLYQALGKSLPLDQINPWHFKAPISPVLAARREKKRVTLKSVLAHVQTIGRNFDVVLIEGAGGLLSPIGVDFNSRDLICALKATPIIVAPNQLGVVNHILLTLEALPTECRTRAQVVLMTPPKADAATSSNRTLLVQLGVKQVCQLPWLGAKHSPAGALLKPDVRKTLGLLAKSVA